MGQGEPLLNLPAVAASYELLHDALGISGRAITVSTVGVPNAIGKLAALGLPVTLAVSIHAPNQALREQLIPSAKVYPIEALVADCAAYFRATRRRVTFEYTLMAGVNDAPHHVRAFFATAAAFPPCFAGLLCAHAPILHFTSRRQPHESRNQHKQPHKQQLQHRLKKTPNRRASSPRCCARARWRRTST